MHFEFWHSFLEYLKLVDGHISCSREYCFSFLAFLKSKLRITINPHLPLVVGMFSQKFFTLENFPCTTTFDALIGGIDRYWCYCKDGRDSVVSIFSFINPSTSSFILAISSSNLILCSMLMCSSFVAIIFVSLIKLLQFTIWTWAFLLHKTFRQNVLW